MSDKNEEKWVEERMDKDEDIRIPEALEPENIEKRLLEKQKEKRKKNRWKYVSAAAAACLCIAVGIAAGSTLLNGDGDGLSAKSGATSDRAQSAEADGTEGGDAASSGSVSDGKGGSDSGMLETEMLVSAKDYDEVYEYIEALAEQNGETGTYSGSDTGAANESAQAGNTGGNASGNTMSGSSMDSASSSGGAARAESYSGTAADSKAGYSDTNVREEGVGEADIVKTDGENLYIVNGQKIFIVGISGGKLEQESVIEKDGDCYISEVYIEDDSLVVIYTKSEYDDGETGRDGMYKDYTYAEVYDVSRPEKPKAKGSVSQSGYYNTMRARDGYVYVFSDFYANTGIARSSVGGYIPEVQGKSIAASDIYMPQYKMGNEYTIITAFSLDKPGEKTDSKAVFGTAGTCYVSSENIYITEPYYGSGVEGEMTTIRKLSYDSGKLKAVAQTKVGGILNDSFSIDEYEGNLRLVTTNTMAGGNGGGIMPLFGTGDSGTAKETNSLYILDGKLNLSGVIDDIAEGESVYSARFMGDTGYFVTFKQVDPLFSVDLSDPEAPKILGELKIPGFSEYLHPYGDGKLLGIGMAVDDEGITTDGVKLSMFDISDPSDVKETDNYVIEEMYGTGVGYNYKEVFVDVEKNLFGFMAYGNGQSYYICSYDEEKGFQTVMERELSGYGNVRGLYAGGEFYLVSGNTVESYSMKDFKKIDDIVL